MFPISKEERLPITIDGIIYTCIPPVGEIEALLVEYTSNETDMEDYNLASNYALAVKEIESKFKNKKKPKKKAWENLISKIMLSQVNKSKEENTLEKGVKKMNKLIDKIVVAWEVIPKYYKPDQLKLIAKFPTCREPSSVLTLGIKTEIISWYFSQFQATDEEAKN